MKKAKLSESVSSSSVNVNKDKIVKLPLPPIQIEPFESNANNVFAYFNFKKTFVNALAGMPNLTGAQKFIYLKGYLKGEALNLVENIPVSDDGFDTAFAQLDFHFLNRNNIIDKVLDEILEEPEVKVLALVEPLVRKLSNKILDLGGLGIDLVVEDSASLLLLSKIVNKKLPRQFLIELSHETGSTVPNSNQLISCYQGVLERLNLGYKQ